VNSVNFDRAAGYYDATRALPAATMTELTGVLAAELAGRPPCLEIGVGTGRFALPLRAAGIEMAGTDISGAMLRRPAANAGGQSPFPLAQADATRQPFAAGAFGSVLAVHVLHLIPDWRIAVDEAIDHVERQLFSWSWPFSADQAAAVAADMRSWAAEAGLPFETAHETETAVRCWAFEVRS
jgi:SAM-dependent methyltransferase